MGRVHEAFDDDLRAFVAAQAVFFVATAPLAADGLVNVSPKGQADTLRLLGDRTVAYLDLTGSGVETVAHVRENGRLTLMWCSFDARPRILRASGRGEVVVPGDTRWEELLGRFGPHVGARAVVVLHVERLADSCGYAVPRYELVGERDVLDLRAAKKGPEALAAYRAERNAESLDGLPGLSPADGR